MTRTLLTAGVVAGLVLLGGCNVNMRDAGPAEHMSKSIEIDKAEMSRVEIKIGVGELKVGGGSSKLMDADFEYAPPTWKPIVRYSATGFRGDLKIEQPSNSGGGSRVTYKWDVRLNDKLPLDLVAHLGVGEAKMTLGSLNMRSLELNMGVGELRVDLRGKPDHDYNVQINGGVGQATVDLPRDVGIVATAHGGIGDISVRGLEKRNGRWINPARENAAVTIHIDVKGGIGNITLNAE
jgi:hypothetical protein